MKGKFSLKRPGRFRFDYSLPSKQVIISDGEYLAIQDLDLNNEDRVALDQTPFRLLLRKDVDIARDGCISKFRIRTISSSSDCATRARTRRAAYGLSAETAGTRAQGMGDD